MQIGMEGEGQGEGPSQPLSQAMGSPSELGEYCNQRFWCVNIPQNSNTLHPHGEILGVSSRIISTAVQ